MSKFIITISGKPTIHGYKRGDFKWVEVRKKYLYLGRVIEGHEFNAIIARVLVRDADLHPQVELLPEEAPAPVSTIAPAGEISLETAVDVVRRLAPDMLKKKPGMKPTAAEEAA